MIKVHTFIVEGFDENCYCLVNEKNHALIVDPGGQANQIIAWIESHEWIPQAVILTHAHMDHIGALDEVRDYFQIEAYIHEIEADYISDGRLNLSSYLLTYDIVQRSAEHLWQMEGLKRIGDFEFEIRHVPGHSPGSIVYIFSADKFVIVGDTLFNGSIGRTDFPGGSLNTLLSGIKHKLLTLTDEYKIYPGHGPMSDIGTERRENQFLIQD